MCGAEVIYYREVGIESDAESVLLSHSPPESRMKRVSKSATVLRLVDFELNLG